MQVPVQISFLRLKPSARLTSLIEEKARALDRVFPRLTSLRVTVSLATRRKTQGNLFHVVVDVTLPGHEIAVGRDPTRGGTHEDPEVAIRDAFAAARRQIKAYVNSHFRSQKQWRREVARVSRQTR